MTGSSRQNLPDLLDSAAFWVAILEQARVTGDVSLVQRAHEELTRLGVHVTFMESPGGRASKRNERGATRGNGK